MLRNFFKTTFRSILKTRGYFVINLLGLALSLACCITAYLNYKYAADFDKQHVNYDRIQKVQINKSIEGVEMPFGMVPLPIGHSLQGELSDVELSVRYHPSGQVLKKEEKTFNKLIGFADVDFFKMFTFPFKYGSPEVFGEKGSIILTENTANVYFGEGNPVGELITVIDDEGDQHSFMVGGVVEDIPQNSTIRFDAVLPFEEYIDRRGLTNTNWNRFIGATFLLTREEEPSPEIASHLNDKYIQIQNSARDDWKVSSYYLLPLKTFAKSAENLRANWLGQAPPAAAVNVPGIMAVLMLLIACFNFTNTSLAVSSRRLKEIGIRKVMGGSRLQLILQFMGENIIISAVALGLGMLIAMWMVPAYSALWDFIDLKLSIGSNPEIFLFLGLLLLFTSVMAGAYPALYVSRFEPVSILRGTLKLGGSSVISLILLGFQYLFTVLALISSLAFIGNAKYQETLDVGFKREGVLNVLVDNSDAVKTFYNEARQIPDVSSAAMTSQSIGRWTYSRMFRNGERELEMDMVDMSIDYMEMMEVELVDGRFFRPDLEEYDRRSAVIVNEETVRQFGWEDPVGQVVQLDDTTRLNVVGVVKDFYMWGFWVPVPAMGIRLSGENNLNFVSVSFPIDKIKNVQSDLQEIWQRQIPNKPFELELEDELAEATLVNKNVSLMFTFLGALALILSSIGLFTLVSLNVIKRVKEIGIRKVLGARIVSIVNLMNRPFVIVLSIAAILGTVCAYLTVDLLLGMIFHYYRPMDVISIVVPLVVMFAISLATSSGRVFKAATDNPVKSLRYE